MYTFLAVNLHVLAFGLLHVGQTYCLREAILLKEQERNKDWAEKTLCELTLVRGEGKERIWKCLDSPMQSCGSKIFHRGIPGWANEVSPSTPAMIILRLLWNCMSLKDILKAPVVRSCEPTYSPSQVPFERDSWEAYLHDCHEDTVMTNCIQHYTGGPTQDIKNRKVWKKIKKKEIILTVFEDYMNTCI